MSWPVVKLGSVIAYIRGITFKPSEVVEPFSNDSIVVMRTKNVQAAGLSVHDLIAVSKANMGRLDQKLRSEDILISSANSWELVGKISYVDNLQFDATAGGFISIVRSKKEKIDSRYLYHWISTPINQHAIRHCGRQTTNISNLDVGRFKELEIPLPPMAEQKRIAAILDKADAIRRKRQQAIQLADDFLRAVFLDMFGDPVTNPKGFKKGPITDLADVVTGFAFKSSEYSSDSEGAVRLCRGTNALTGYLDWSDTAYWPKERVDEIENYQINAGDVILAMDRPWISSGLKVSVFPKNQRDTYLVQRVARLRPLHSSYTDYLYSCIKSKAFERHCCPTETTVPHISPVELKNYRVLMPSKELIEQYHSRVQRTKINLDRMRLSGSRVAAFFDSLSQKSFGQKIVSETL